MDLVQQIKEAGVIGAGGAGFPTHAKFTAKAEYILLNGAECEPLLRVDQQLMERFPDEIINGLAAAGRYIEARKAVIGIKGKHKEVIALLRARIDALGLAGYMEVMELRDMYPAGDEQVLVYELTKRVVPETSIPLKVGCVVINAETALNIYKAMAGQPVTETYLTIAGDIPRRMTVKVPVGMAIRDVLQQCGITNPDDYAVIDGGPMMGSVLSGLDGFVSKKSKGYILLKKDHFLIRKKSVSVERARVISKTACEQCRMCTDLCPRYLLGHNMQPHKIMRALSYQLADVKEQQIAQLCCECNLCELFSCPANLHPRSVNKFYKQKLAEQGLRYQPVTIEYKPRAARDYRLLPSKRLVAKIGLTAFDKPAPMTAVDWRPEYISIGLRQHIGAPAIPVVAVGDQVQAGQLIGKIPDNSLGAAVHASLNGTVTEITDNSIVIKVG
ncbi:4Fe-4S dicluster domain-containing protein [Desulforamulus hydrothermalis]|uniref:Respiratory-chain NADH dehydrogenase domain, 51 kDa subunit n=1 Tax=Desulforamulus hydrothermalis Lam5 = DSM 18033 TaxID=1121428 RepID=K8DYC2_9FIRM|nr:4Fe-4S dicluster domain-containing protein [Desulforamulus hydrothermalis]CCO07725.1 Respiratory-chain NADH dehydrogenase domain, 51 kDa subunit [Desulforamulus hydrothermalis Lam5 = DSM 18033]SHH33850.1 Na+-translocating ferredoxin:NAD+ oxidoreductase RNF, RnfC subunit [Desulforamulus hydrothermalis Lam5 = DSM 18033]